MAMAGHPDGLSFGMERILRLDSPPSVRQGEPDSTSGGRSERWPPLPLPSSGVLSPIVTTTGRTPPPSPPPPVPPLRPVLLPPKPPLYSFCSPPLPPYLQLGGRPGQPPPACPACPDLWPMACHHLLQGSESRFPPSLVAGRRLGARRKRTWTRAVFTNLQRKGLEKRFTVQRYITKPERRKLADTLGLTDSQVKVWFQNRRMKWRNSRQAAERAAAEAPAADSTQPSADDDSAQPINVED